MKNVYKKFIASVIAVSSLTISTAGINVNAADTNALRSNEGAISRITYYESRNFDLSGQYEELLTGIEGSRTVSYTASVNQSGVTIIVKNNYGFTVESHYFSAGYAPTFYVDVPSNQVYKFYAYSSTASSSSHVIGTAYFSYY